MKEASTQSANVTVKLGHHTAGDPNFGRPWVGDFPLDDHRKKVLGPTLLPNTVNLPYVPQTGCGGGLTWDGSTITIDNRPKWRVVKASDRITLSCDVPGVKLDDLNVEINNGTVWAKGKRSDTGTWTQESQFIGLEYDASSAEATLEDGVLTIVVMCCKERMVQKVPVRKK